MSAWKTVALSDVATSVVYGVTASASQQPLGPKFLRITDIQNGAVNWDDVPWCECDTRSASDARLKTGDIVFARTGATTGKSFLIHECPGDAVFASYLIRVRLGDAVVPRFVSHFFQTQNYWTQITAGARGVAQPGVNATTLKALKVPLPPLAEQRRIAQILDQAEELRAKRRAALAQLDTLTQSIFLDMFGDPVRNPKGWAMQPFGEVCDMRLGKMLDQKQQTGQHIRPYLRNANVQWFRFELADVSEMDFDEKARKIFCLEDGDLLICEGGEPGRAAVWRGEIKECYYQKALHRARPRADLAVPEFLAWQLWFLAQGGGLGDHVTSATIAHLTGEKLNAMTIPLPPIELQRTFAHRIAAVEKLKATQRAALAELDTLFAALQQRAFRGEL